ncbi:hypothetical protein ACJMK2_044653 [Sinanodonta woodiana]|uniref:Zinc finger PHD-type domain-containing protein n=1 Tax=Sinanodonta woodiana TaxID=1069815 RepID=A0ABD3W1B2_SINWO
MRHMDLNKADIAKSFLHYHQVQCQLFVCNTNYVDFVVWTRQPIHLERIEKCHVFWEDMLPKALHVFRVGILPELLSICYTHLPLQNSKGVKPGPSSAIDQLSESTSVPLYNSKAYLEPSNVAHQPSEPMVACDDQNCKFQLFHFDCVYITSKPKGKWYCPECSTSRISKVN